VCYEKLCVAFLFLDQLCVNFLDFVLHMIVWSSHNNLHMIVYSMCSNPFFVCSHSLDPFYFYFFVFMLLLFFPRNFFLILVFRIWNLLFYPTFIIACNSLWKELSFVLKTIIILIKTLCVFLLIENNNE